MKDMYDDFIKMKQYVETMRCKYPENVVISQVVSFNDIRNKNVGITVAYYGEVKSWQFIHGCVEDNRKHMKELCEFLKKLEWKVILTKDSGCAGDEHEECYYPRSSFKSKPVLKKGTILSVDKQWNNLYGEYYRCYHENGIYDIPISKAKYYEGIIINKK